MSILVLTSFNEKQLEVLKAAAGGNLNIKSYETATKLDFEQAHIIVGNPSAENLKYCKNLLLLQLESAGADQYCKDGVLPQGTILCNSRGAYGLSISEYMIGMLLQIYRRFPDYWEDQKNGAFGRDHGKVCSIYGARVLILGLGDIGSEFARRVKAFGGYTIGVRRSSLSCPEYLDEIHLAEDLEELLPDADVVSLSLPATKETYHILNRERIALLKKEAVVLNVGRGSAIDTEALADALERGKLFGAGLDVTDPEPLPKSHRLLQLSNVFITPHISGGHHLEETVNRIAKIAAYNIRGLRMGKERLLNMVNQNRGY